MEHNRFFELSSHVARLVLGSFTTLVLGTLVVHPAYADYTKDNSLAGVVYTETNIPITNGNSILGYRRDANGKLTPLPGSPYLTNGAGISSDINSGPRVFDTDQNIIVNREHTLLFAVNSGSSTIAVFHIHPDGSLSPVKGSPFYSGGVDPVSLGLAGDFLYVAHRNIDPQNPPNDAVGVLPNYTAFKVKPNGSLVPIPKSTVEVPVGTTPSQALISPDQKLVFGADQFGGVLRSFKILPDGRLLEASTSPLPIPASEFTGTDARVVVVGLRTHPTLPLLYASFPSISRLAVYSYDRETGALTFIKTVANTNAGTPCWIFVNKTGKVLYTANPGNNTLSVFSLADPTTPVQIQNLTLSGQGGPFQIGLDEATESFLEAVTQRNSDSIPLEEGNGIHTLKVNPIDGTLTEVDSSPLLIPGTNGSRPQGIAPL
jgi:6-phosphogluconolactonase (cycloisomerase 2 family)